MYLVGAVVNPRLKLYFAETFQITRNPDCKFVEFNV